MEDVQRYVEYGKFDVELTTHEVGRLIYEDYEPVINFLRNKKTGLYTPMGQTGRIYYREGGSVRLIEAANAFRLFLNFFIEGIRQALEQNPRYRLDRIVWPS
jgi:hypothetical protein